MQKPNPTVQPHRPTEANNEVGLSEAHEGSFSGGQEERWLNKVAIMALPGQVDGKVAIIVFGANRNGFGRPICFFV